MNTSPLHVQSIDLPPGIRKLSFCGGFIITLILGFGYTKINAQGEECIIPGYTFGGNYEGHSYYISNELAIWMEAKALAESIGGHLATISDANENAFVVEIVDDAYLWDYAWIGLTDEDVEGVYVWVTGEPLIYTNWGSPGGAEDDYTAVHSSYYGANWSSYESPPAIGVYIVEFESLIVEFESLICNCDDPVYAGYDNSITICNDSSPFDLTEAVGIFMILSSMDLDYLPIRSARPIVQVIPQT
jgi:Lectin C-type domain